MQSGAQVAGQASGIQPQMGPTEPQYPAGLVTFENGQAVLNKQALNLRFDRSRDRSAEPQSGVASIPSRQPSERRGPIRAVRFFRNTALP